MGTDLFLVQYYIKTKKLGFADCYFFLCKKEFFNDYVEHVFSAEERLIAYFQSILLVQSFCKANGIDYWIVCRRIIGNTFISYLRFNSNFVLKVEMINHRRGQAKVAMKGRIDKMSNTC